MSRRYLYPVLLVALLFGLAACKQSPGIIQYQSPLARLKNVPHDTTKQDDKAAAQTHTQLAAVYMGQGHLKEAETALRRALKFDDKYIPAHTMLAILDWRIDRLQDASQEFRTAISLNPSDGDTNNNYGKFLCAQGKPQDAMHYFKRALADPFYKTPAVANTNAGECLTTNGQYAAAVPYLHNALEIDHDFRPALLAMANLDYRQGKAFQARGYLQRFETAGEATPESLLLGYEIATRLGDRATATNYSNRLQDQFPNSRQAQSLNGPTHD